MPSTIKIPKSKALNFRKISFLYLIFFTMYFLSSTGEFIEQFAPLNNTHKALNMVMEKQFTKIEPIFPKDQNLKNKAAAILGTLTEFETLEQNSLQGVRLENIKSRQFIKQNILNDSELYKKLKTQFKEFLNCFNASEQSTICKEAGIDFNQFIQSGEINTNLFLETPNGVIGSVIQQLKSSVLTHSLTFFKVQTEFGKLVRIESATDSSFLQGYKENYFVGEKIEFDFFSKDSVAPEITLNQSTLTPLVKGRHYITSWIPTKAGTYLLSAKLGTEFLNFPLKVTKPSLRFLEEEQQLAAYLSEPLELTLDLSGMENIAGLNFVSDGAKVIQQGSKLTIIPHYEGKFQLEMYANNLLLDSRTLDAIKGKNPKVTLRDIAGKSASLGNAHCLESTSPYWQVLDFSMTVCLPNGEKKTLKSKTRFLRNEIRTAEKTAPKGSLLLFHDIRLLNVNGRSTIQGSPIHYIK